VASRLIVTSAEDDNTWEEFDVLSAVQQWVEEPRSNRGLVVEAELGNGIGRVRLSRVVDFDGPAPAVSYSEVNLYTFMREKATVILSIHLGVASQYRLQPT